MSTGPYPGGAEFAFTILDDTDDTTLEKGRPIYQLLKDLGLRTTKTVWAFEVAKKEKGPYFAAETLQEPEYLEWVRGLASDGFEVAFHNASMGSSRRSQTVAGLDLLRVEFPPGPSVHCNHGQNRENLYWGADRYSSFPLRHALKLAQAALKRPAYEGHEAGSEYFWGDVARERLRYVRAFAFSNLNCADLCPGRPYFDPRKPLVNRWFNTADAPDRTAFKRLVTPRAVDELRAKGGWAIVSTHLGKGFSAEGRVDPEVEATLTEISSQPGWFVPVGELLDFLWDSRGPHTLSDSERLRLEYSHVVDRIVSRKS